MGVMKVVSHRQHGRAKGREARGETVVGLLRGELVVGSTAGGGITIAENMKGDGVLQIRRLRRGGETMLHKPQFTKIIQSGPQSSVRRRRYGGGTGRHDDGSEQRSDGAECDGGEGKVREEPNCHCHSLGCGKN